MIFKIMGIGKDIRDARNDPSGFMAEKLVEVIRGVFLLWKIVLLLPFIPLIIFGFTKEWGGPYNWVRIITFVWFGIVAVAFFVMTLVIRLLHRKTKKVADIVITSVKETIETVTHD